MSARESARIERRLSTEPAWWSRLLSFTRVFDADSGDENRKSRAEETERLKAWIFCTMIGGQRPISQSSIKQRNLRHRLYVGG
jgi:hypothetical protein